MNAAAAPSVVSGWRRSPTTRSTPSTRPKSLPKPPGVDRKPMRPSWAWRAGARTHSATAWRARRVMMSVSRSTSGQHGPVIVLLPPSEGKAEGGRGTWSFESGSFAALGERRRAVVAALTEADPKVFGATGARAERAADAVRALVAHSASALPAWKRFTGVVWEHLDPATLP